MPLLSIPLRSSSGPGGRVWLRDLCGADEQELEGTDTAAAISLLDRLIVARPDAGVLPGQAAQLSTADRDQVLAALCSASFGDRVDSTVTCERCSERFDLDFRLREMAEAVVATLPPPPPDGGYSAGETTRFRLPTGADELAVMGLPPERAEDELLRRCVLAGDPLRDRSTVLAAMAKVGPTLDLDLDAACAECGHRHAIAFSIQAWLLGHLEQGRRQLPQQIHILARAYGWSLADILSLPREHRLTLVELALADRRAASRGPLA